MKQLKAVKLDVLSKIYTTIFEQIYKIYKDYRHDNLEEINEKT